MAVPIRNVTILAIVLLAYAAAPTGAAAASGTFDPETYDCANGDGQAVLPGAVTFERPDGQRYWTGRDANGDVAGWVALSTEIVDIKGYSGHPLVTLVGLGADGTIRGVRILEHSEPILLVGIPEEKLRTFTEAYVGLPAIAKVSVGGSSSDPDAHAVDAISGATVTVLAEDRTIMETARQLGMAAGVVTAAASVPGHFVEEDGKWSWSRLEKEGVFGRLTVRQGDVGKDAYGHGTTDDPDAPFIDLFFTIADAPHVGRSLLGDREYEWAMGQLAPGEHILLMFGRGASSFRGSGFVRGGIFDRIRVEQGLTTLMFTDRDYHRLSQPRAEGSPRFREAAWFRTAAGRLDPGRRYQVVFLASRFSGHGGFDRIFSTFKGEHRLPRSVYRLDGPDPEQAIWRAAWRTSPEKTVVTAAYLLGVIVLFSLRRWTTARTPRLKWIHRGVQLGAIVILGIWLRAQPSVTQVLTFFNSLVREWRWGLFLSEPQLVVSWIFIVIVTVAWGRGVFCGWTCPYGAFNEWLFLIGQKLGLPARELPERIHRRARWLRYGIFLVLLGTFLVSSPLGEKMAEVEPFKSTFFVPFWTRPWGFIAWWVALAVASLFVYRPFCRYLCPLGAALAVPSSLRISGPYRRDFCRRCRICTVRCEPRAIRADGTIDARECLSCMECESNYRNDRLCPPLVRTRKAAETAAPPGGGS